MSRLVVAGIDHAWAYSLVISDRGIKVLANALLRYKAKHCSASVRCQHGHDPGQHRKYTHDIVGV
jgi:hypothetical protein